MPSYPPFAPRRAARLFALGSAASALALAALGGPGCGGHSVIDLPAGEGAGGTVFHGEGGLGGGVSSSSVATTTTSATSGGGGAPQPPDFPALAEVDLGEIHAGVPVSFPIGPGTLGFTLLVEPPGAYDRLGVAQLVPPSGPPVIQEWSLPPTGWEYAWYGITVAAVPQSDAPAAMPVVMNGPWQFTLGDPDGIATTGHVSVWMRQTVDGAFHGGLLDVNVFLADGVTTPEYLTEMLIESYDGYAGLGLGTVTFYPLPQQYAVIDSVFSLFEALEQTAGAAGKPALNVLAIADLTGELDQAAGVAAGIPGQGVKHGTHSSGVIMEVFEDSWFDSIILEHEGGHLAGLFHTSEIEPPFHDPLSDTGYCEDLSGDIVDCPDYDNIMFPYGSEAKARTPMQDRVIQGSAMYRGIVVAGGPPAAPLPMIGAPGNGKGNSKALPEPILVVDASQRARLPHARKALPRSRAWAAGLPAGMADVLSGVWCHGQAGARLRPEALLERLGGDDPALLLAIGADATAPWHVRKRALAAAGRAAPPEEVVAVLVEMAGDAGAPRAVRIGALRGLEAAGAAETRGVAEALLRGGDAVVALVAARVLERGR